MSPEMIPAVTGDSPTSKGAPRGQQVVGRLRNAIIAGRIVPGERLIEASLSQKLGTSRGPVREALRQLENEGLVMSIPYKGAVVLGVSDEEVQQVLIPIRIVLERYSFSKALELMTDEDFAELGKQIWVMEQAALKDDLLGMVEADLQFHEIVLDASRQLHTAQLWRSIEPRIRAYFARYGRGADLQVMAEEHRELLAVMQSGDVETVLQHLEQHIAVRTPDSHLAPAVSRKRKRGARTAGA